MTFSKSFFFTIITVLLPSASAFAQYAPPAQSARVLRGVDFAVAQTIAPDLTQVYRACDASRERGGCATDPARNTVMLKFPDSVAGGGIVTTAGPVFFDAKMAIDADGSTLSKRAERPNQPETALRYPTNGESLDSERVPYIVMPLGNFRQETGVALGDLAAVVKDGQVHFAIVGDLGPRTHLGEGSMALHAAFGHLDCKAHDAQGNCSQFVDVSLDPPVLYFVFPESRGLVMDGLSPENINVRIERMGMQLWSAFLIEQGGRADLGGVGGGGLSLGMVAASSEMRGSLHCGLRPSVEMTSVTAALRSVEMTSVTAAPPSIEMMSVQAAPRSVEMTSVEGVAAPGELLRSFAPLRMTPSKGQTVAEGSTN